MNFHKKVNPQFSGDKKEKRGEKSPSIFHFHFHPSHSGNYIKGGSSSWKWQHDSPMHDDENNFPITFIFSHLKNGVKRERGRKIESIFTWLCTFPCHRHCRQRLFYRIWLSLNDEKMGEHKYVIIITTIIHAMFECGGRDRKGRGNSLRKVSHHDVDAE